MVLTLVGAAALLSASANAATSETTGSATGAKSSDSATSGSSAGESKVTTLPGGTKVEELKIGTGAEVRKGMAVQVLYRGSLEDGTVFDESAKHGNTPLPIQAVGSRMVIPGFDDGLVGIKVGGKRRLTIPGSQAYGPRPPRGSSIPPNATLIFEIEAVEAK
jgi:FKBP-type peptidyl-prolyl cis-trans isomerase